MAKEIVSLLFSMVDFASIFVFTMCLFHIPLKNKVNIIKLIGSTAVLSIISHIIINIGLQKYSLYILITLVALTFKFVFSENGIYSIWISVCGYVFVLTLQMFIIFGSIHYSIINPSDAIPYTLTAYLIQVSTFIIVSAISFGILKFGSAMTFDFSNVFGQKANFKSPMPYIVSSIVIFLFMSIAYPQFYGGAIDQSFYRSIVSGCLCIVVLLMLSIHRNNEESQRVFKKA